MLPDTLSGVIHCIVSVLAIRVGNSARGFLACLAWPRKSTSVFMDNHDSFMLYQEGMSRWENQSKAYFRQKAISIDGHLSMQPGAKS